MRTFIEGLPKAELHLHIEGTLEPELKFALSDRNGIEIPYKTVEEIKASYVFHDLTSFLVGYYDGMNVLIEEDDFYDLAMAYFRVAKAQNIVYAEPFFDPQAHTSRGVPFANIINGLHRAQLDAEAEFGLKTNLIMCFLRDMPAESAMETLEASLPYKDWIMGIGLDSDERGHPPVKFKEVYGRAREEGYRLTMHCDVNQDNAVQHIWQALDEIGVERIDHGVNSLEDENLIAEIVRREIPLTVCPISNRYVTGSLTGDEIKTMLEKGMRAMINSDDPSYMQAYLNENLIALVEECDFNKEQIVQLAKNSFLATWMSDDDKARYVAMVEEYAG
ncbi:MAG: adenosine deaminase [Acidimicrobiia bacterium]|nr:adenosine deaminase [Acidimicrobiia bacterium]MDX2467747.1 adenosine deaminase [Acidimicrobiia bacterium]